MRLLLTSSGLALILASLVTFQAQAQSEMRSWVSRDKSETVEASFQSYDPKSKQVSIQLLDGEVLEVNLRQLSRADQRYVTNVARNQPLQRVETLDEKPRREKKTRRNKPGSSAGTKKAFGIHWTPGIQAALENASGSESSEDDRPVMWMRVLGDLDGFM